MPPADSTIERNEGDNRFNANIFLVVIVVQAILCEANVIKGLWFKEASYDYGWNRYTLPVCIAVPALFMSLFRMQVSRWVAQRKLTADLAARISSVFGVALMIAYLCILELAELTFRAR
jgi:hypothetical protein